MDFDYLPADPEEAVFVFKRQMDARNAEMERSKQEAAAAYAALPQVTKSEVSFQSVPFQNPALEVKRRYVDGDGAQGSLQAIYLWTQYNAGATFDGSVSTARDDDPIVDWSWDFGDGSTGDGELVSHFFDPDNPDWPATPDPPGTYIFTVTLTVTTQSGAAKSVSGTVTLIVPQPDEDLHNPVVHRVPPASS